MAQPREALRRYGLDGLRPRPVNHAAADSYWSLPGELGALHGRDDLVLAGLSAAGGYDLGLLSDDRVDVYLREISADCMLRSLDFADIEVLQREGRWDEDGRRLAFEARALVAGGADLLVLCTNTMHNVAAAITDAVEVPFVHIGDTTADTHGVPADHAVPGRSRGKRDPAGLHRDRP